MSENSDRFWGRTLRHLPGHGGGYRPSMAGVTVVKGKNGPVYRVGPTFDKLTVPPTEDPSIALNAELAAQRAARSGK